jgi:hypothetical protein
MSRRRIQVTYEVVEFVDLDIEDKALTRCEIDAAVENAIDSKGFPSDVEWDWVASAPTPKDLPSNPPDACWIEIEGMEWATNGMMAVSRGLPIKVVCTQDWVLPSERIVDALKAAIAYYTPKMPPHPGKFNQAVIAPFINLSASIFGFANQPGYVVVDDELIAIVMPLQDKDIYL